MPLSDSQKARRAQKRRIAAKLVKSVTREARKSSPNPSVVLSRKEMVKAARQEMWRMCGAGQGIDERTGKRVYWHPGTCREKYRMEKWGVESVEEFAEKILKWRLPEK